MSKLARRVFCVIGVICSGLSLALVYTINQMINRPVLASPGVLADKDYTEFFTVSEDGIKIYAVYYRGIVGAGTVILCHGHGVELGRMNDMVKFLRVAGYGVLLFDFRAHGRSGGKISTIGLHEWKDVKAVIVEAKKLGFIDEKTSLAAYGRSMGAATLINGAAELPEIKAFILESSFERLRKIAARDAWNALYLPDTFLTDLGIWLTSKVVGVDYGSNNPEENTRGISNRAVFLIHDEKDRRASADAFVSLKSRLPQAVCWSVPGAWHVCAHFKAPVQFETRFLSFLFKSGVYGRQ